MENLLKVENLSKRYKEFSLDSVSFTLPRGCIMGIIGPNGAGKTTTIKLIMNLIRTDSGHIEVFGLHYHKDAKEIKNRIGYVGEEQYFYQDKTVAWTGEFVSHFFSQWDVNQFNGYLEEFSISRSKKVRELSRGMKVKLSLAIALSHHPELLILDEPTSGLDPIIRREIMDLLLRLSQGQECSVILSSHITDDLARVADMVSFMVNGKIVLTKEKDELLANWKRIHYKPGVLDEAMVAKLFQVREQVFGCSGITDRYIELKRELSSGLAKGDIKIENVGLDDILIACVNG